MTSASELFYSRRHRLGRNSLHLGLDSSPLPDLHHHHPRRHNHHHVRRLPHHPSSSSAERGGDRLDWRYGRSLLNDGGDDDSAGNVVRGISRARGPRVSAADRSLPAGVLLARARLVERLRGEPVSLNRQYDRDSMGGDQENELSSDVLDGGSLVTDLTSQMGRSQLLQEHKKPPGLTQEALDCLHVEVFSCRDTGLESRILQDCGICLESFMDGDKLIRLPCGHKFHSHCLDPWVRCCGDCPYCRRGIVVNCNLTRKQA